MADRLIACLMDVERHVSGSGWDQPVWQGSDFVVCPEAKLPLSTSPQWIHETYGFFMAVLAFATGNLFSALSGQQVMKARGVHDTMLFSGTWRGFFDLHATGPSSHIYLGYGLVAWMVLSALVWLVVVLRGRRRDTTELRPILFLFLVLAFTGLLLCLSLGPRGPFNGATFLAVREWVHPYRMIRQAAKYRVYLQRFSLPLDLYALHRMQPYPVLHQISSLFCYQNIR